MSKTIPATYEGDERTLHICEGCGSSFITDYADPLGHSWDEGEKTTGVTCAGKDATEYACIRYGVTRLEGDKTVDHILGNPATCTNPQLYTRCGTIIENTLGRDCAERVTEPVRTGVSYTTCACTHCDDVYEGDYTETIDHKSGDWVIDKEPTTNSEGSRHREYEVCGEELEEEAIEKIYNQVTTDSKGEAVMGDYPVIVTDTDTRGFASNAIVVLHADGTLSVRLLNSRQLDYIDQTTVAVLLTRDKSTIKGMFVTMTNKHDNYCADSADSNG